VRAISPRNTITLRPNSAPITRPPLRGHRDLRTIIFYLVVLIYFIHTFVYNAVRLVGHPCGYLRVIIEIGKPSTSRIDVADYARLHTSWFVCSTTRVRLDDRWNDVWLRVFRRNNKMISRYIICIMSAHIIYIPFTRTCIDNTIYGMRGRGHKVLPRGGGTKSYPIADHGEGRRSGAPTARVHAGVDRRRVGVRSRGPADR